VWGADLVRDSRSGVTQSIFGELVDDLAVSVVPALSLTQAGDALMTIAGLGGTVLRAPELTIVRLASGEYRLVYSAVMAGGELVPTRLFVDAHTGHEVLRISELQSQTPTAGTAHGVLGDTKKISVSNENGTYIADDRLRPPSLLTFDMRGNLNRARSIVLNGASLLPSDLAQDADNDWTDVAQVDAHVHVGWTYDYLFKRFGRRGLDDRDRPIRIITNAVTQQGALTVSPAVLGEWVVQAFWCDSCGPGSVGVIFFGNGFPTGYTLGGRHYTYFAGALDIVAHELTHGVTTSTSNLIYQDESGALNESFSDVIGTSVEFYYHPQGDGKGRADYVLGEDISTGVARGEIDGDRSMANPAAHDHPDHYSRRFRGTEDNGGVHINSSIPNHAFYLAIEGGTNRTSGLPVEGVGAANREQIEKVFYRAFAFLLPSSARFSTARAATIQAARDLYGANSPAERAMTQAWTAVGVN
jgi:thermolysin